MKHPNVMALASGFLILFMDTMHSWAANESSWFHDDHPKIRPSPRWISSTSKLFIFVFAGWITVESLLNHCWITWVNLTYLTFSCGEANNEPFPRRLLGHGYSHGHYCFIPMAATPNLGPMAIVHLILGGDRHPSHRLFFSPEILQNNMRIHGLKKNPVLYSTWLKNPHDDMGPMGHPFSWGKFG